MWLFNGIITALGIIFALRWPWVFALVIALCLWGHWMAARHPVQAPEAEPPAPPDRSARHIILRP